MVRQNDRKMLKEALINLFAVIPVTTGIQQRTELKTLDSGSPQSFARNDELISASLT